MRSSTIPDKRSQGAGVTSVGAACGVSGEEGVLNVFTIRARSTCWPSIWPSIWIEDPELLSRAVHRRSTRLACSSLPIPFIASCCTCRLLPSAFTVTEGNSMRSLFHSSDSFSPVTLPDGGCRRLRSSRISFNLPLIERRLATNVPLT